MPAHTQLRNALSAIDEAKRKLIRLNRDGVNESEASQIAHEVRRAIRDLDQAGYSITRAIQENQHS